MEKNERERLVEVIVELVEKIEDIWILKQIYRYIVNVTKED